MKLTTHKQTIQNENLQIVSHQGRDHWVLPVIMMVEGVHQGSAGPLLYEAAELGKFVEAWDGIPVVIGHPEASDGHSVSANTPDGMTNVVGRLFNTRMEGLQLKSEAWVDIKTIETNSPEAYEYIKNEQALEVSIGVYSEETNTQGTFNNEEYRAVAQNLRPDHLALLPGSVGACSWDDGCGVRTNQSHKLKKDVVKNLKTLTAKELLKEGIGFHLISNETGFREVMRTIQRKLDQLDGNGRIYYLDEIYDERIVYRMESNEMGGTSYYQRNYEVKDDGTIEFTSSPEQVRKDITFVVMESGKLKRTKLNSNHNNNKMEITKCCAKKVEALIANKATQYTDEHKEWLSTFSEEQLDSMVPNELENPAVTENKETEKETSAEVEVSAPVVNKETLKETVKAIFNESKDPNEFIDNFMPDGLKGQMKSGLKMYGEKRSQLIEGIVKNSKFEAEALKGWEDNDLQNLHDSVVPADFSAAGESHLSTNSSTGLDNGMESMLNLPQEAK